MPLTTVPAGLVGTGGSTTDNQAFTSETPLYENVQTISEVISTLKVDILDVYETFPTGIHTMDDAKILVKSLKTLLDEKLLNLAKKTFDDIDDTLVFTSSPFRDWINMDGFAPPPPPKDAPKPNLF